MEEDRERTTFLVIIVGALIAVLLGGFYWILHTSNISDPPIVESISHPSAPAPVPVAPCPNRGNPGDCK